MQDPFRPNSNAQLMREAQIGLIVVGLLLCVLVYVAFYRLTNRSTRFDEISRNVPVAEPVDSDPYRARDIVEMEQKLEQRLEGNNEKPFPAVETFSSRLKKNAASSQQSLPDPKVAQATHVAPQPQSGGFVAKSTFTDEPPVANASSGFAPITHRDSTTTKLNHIKLPKKPQKLKPPVLKSEFGSTPSQDFRPVPISKEKEIKTDTSSFSPAPSVPPKAKTSVTSKIAPKPKPKPPVPKKVDELLKRQLAAATIKDQPSSFRPQPLVPREKPEPKKSDFSPPQKPPTIAQTSAIEPIEPAAIAVLEPSVTSAKPRNESDQTYTTRKGDSLWTIAQASYGDGRYFRALHRVNQETLSLSESIPLGKSLTVPTVEELQRDYPDLCPKQEKKNFRSQDQPDALGAVGTDDKQQLDERFYVTEDGDTLFEIARQRFGQASRYLEIYELNRFRIPETANHLTPLGGGIELLLPK